MSNQRDTITGVYLRSKWTSDDGSFVIAQLDDETTIKGPIPVEGFTSGLTYQFFGRKKTHKEYGDQFEFQQSQLIQPHTRNGIITYLCKYAPNIGPKIAGLLFDAWGTDAVNKLRNETEIAIGPVGRWITLEKAKAAAKALQEIARLEDTKIELTNLFDGRSFPGALVDECVEKWGILAPERVKRDPFCLLVAEMAGCGFARCDKLYIDVGLPPGRIKRCVMCLWYILHSDSSGSTWLPGKETVQRMLQMVGVVDDRPNRRKKRTKGERVQAVVKIARQGGWIATYRDEAGQLWIAEGERAREERLVAEKLVALSSWSVGERGDVKQGAA